MPRWHFGSPEIPRSVLLLSAVALMIPLVAAMAGGGEPVRFEALIWLTALIPAFLLAYYRGWRGAATGLAGGMVVFSVAQVVLVLSGTRLPDWPYMLSITIAFIGLTFLLGGVTERVHMDREKAEWLALYDELTGLPNRRYLGLLLEKEFAAAQRGRPVAAIAFDLDGLKEVNDRYGHAAGDSMIRVFARVLQENTRTMDLSARIGGDEFVTLLSQSGVSGAGVFVERLLRALDTVGGVPVAVQVSAGIAGYAPEMRHPEELLSAADRALYRAKTRQRAV